MQSFSNPPSRRGAYTLTELSIVLGIIGVILGGIWITVAQLNNNRRVADYDKEVLNIVSAMRQTFGSSMLTNGSQDYTAFLINSNLVPSSYVVPCNGLNWGASYTGNNGCLVTPWNTQIHVDTQTGYGGSPSALNYFGIWTANLTVQQCPAFLMSFLQQGVSSGLIWVYTDQPGGMAVNSTTRLDTFQNCSGQVGLIFKL